MGGWGWVREGGGLSSYICPYSMTTLQCQRVSLESRFRICAQIVDIACWMYVVG